MIGNKYTGDSIAAEFMRIMNSKNTAASPIQKSASVENDLVEAAEGMLMDEEPEREVKDPVENALETVENMLGDDEVLGQEEPPVRADLSAHASFTASEKYLIKGLAKIGGDLRRKGEPFAADMVEATAKSIYGDIVKESSYRKSVARRLSKVAKSLSSSGENMASDLVKASIRRIKRG